MTGVSSLTAAWRARWSAHPSQPVLWTALTRWLDGDDLLRRSQDAANRIAWLGLRPGDRVLLSGVPSADLAVAYVSLLRLGLVVVPAGSGATARELAGIADDVRPALGILDDPLRLPGLRSLTPDLPVREVHHANLDAAQDDDPALIGFTSGTTGRPKGAVLSHANLSAGVEALIDAWGWTTADRLVLALPLHHIHGLGVALTGTFSAGASAVLLPRFDAGAVVDAVAQHDATLFFGVPTMYSKIAAAGRLADLEPLRLCVSGSAPLSPVLWERIRVESGQRVLERFGMTETMMLTSNPLDGVRRPGTVGMALPGVSVRLAAGTGEVEVIGPSVFAGYWERPEAEPFTDDGWFRTGDVGEWDDAGYLRLVGRRSDLIITGGYNVYPREVEDALREHPAVFDAAVVGAPDEEWGEVVTAFVVPMRHSGPASAAPPPLDPEELSAFLSERVSPYKRPRRWHVVDDLPRNSMGKVLRSRLAELV